MQEAQECIQYLKEKSKQVFQKEHNDHTYTSQSQRTDEQNKNDLKVNHTCPINQIYLIHANQLITESSSTNNSRTTSAQAKTSTVVIPNTAIGRIIERKGNKINKIQSQNNVEITTSLTVSDYQVVKITGNANNINNALKGEIEIVKNNEKVNIQHYKWVGLNRQNKEKEGIRF